MYTKEEALARISVLVEKFSDQLPAYKKTDYNETLTRKDFIDPFFEALGWDINNRSGAWEAYREVIHEDKLKIGGVTTAPDYEIVDLVDKMLELNKEKQNLATERTDQLNQRIAYTDEKINKLVYELYGLTEEEIGIVEGRI